MSVTRIQCRKCGYPLAWCECGKPEGQSEGALCEVPGPAKVVAAVPTGSLSVSDCKRVAYPWAVKAHNLLNESRAAMFQRRNEDAHRLEQVAQAYLDCCKELQAATERSEKRQPTENKPDEERPAGRNS